MNDNKQRHPITEGAIYMLRWTLFSLAVGAVGGLLGGGFSWCIKTVTGLRTGRPWVVCLLPLLGLIIVFLYKITGEEKNRGTNMVLSAISETDEVTKPTGPLIFVSTVLSHLGGASVGREGAALQLGGWLGARVGELVRLDEKDRRTAIMTGMAAVFAALFGTPVAAAVFCIEVISVGSFYYAALVPCIFAAFTGSYISHLLGAHAEAWTILSVPEVSPGLIGWSVLLGILCAVLATVLVVVLHKVEHLAKHWMKNPYLRVLASGVLFAGLTLLIRTQDYTGSGTVLIDAAMAESVRPWDFILKLAFTAIAIAGGFRGGEIVPTLAMGATFGALFGQITGFPVSLGAACGMIALFAGATNCPIASMLIAMEMFHGAGLPYYAVTVSLSFVLSGYYSLYGSQRFTYSKTRAEAIDRKSN